MTVQPSLARRIAAASVRPSTIAAAALGAGGAVALDRSGLGKRDFPVRYDGQAISVSTAAAAAAILGTAATAGTSRLVTAATVGILGATLTNSFVGSDPAPAPNPQTTAYDRSATEGPAHGPTAPPAPEQPPTETPAPTPTEPPPPTETPVPTETPAPAETPQSSEPALEPATFQVASFNVLGASHTDHADPTHPRMREAAARLPGAIRIMDQKWGVDVAGMQEFQTSQQRMFRQQADGFGMAARKDNAIVWRTDMFRKREVRWMDIPYFDGRPKPMPVVRLRHRETKQEAWFINIHNPTSNKRHPGNDGHRAEALRIERQWVDELRKTGMPVFLVGDFNDKKAAYEAIVKEGGSVSSKPPEAETRIDWVFGTGPMEFLEYNLDESPKQEGVSDHPIVVTTTRIGGAA